MDNDLLTAAQVLELVAHDAELHSAISRWIKEWSDFNRAFHQFRQRKVGLCEQTPASYGAAFGDRKMLALLNRFDALKYESETVLGPLFAACQVGNRNIARLFMENGALRVENAALLPNEFDLSRGRKVLGNYM